MGGRPEIITRVTNVVVLRRALLILPLLLAIHSTAAIAEDSRAATVAAQFTAAGTEGCERCHGGDNMAVMAATAHGDTADPHAPYARQGCESCHGPGSLHVSRARGGAGFPALLRFGDKQTRPQQTAACLDCHGSDMGDIKGMAWTGSLHDTPRMTCVSCHQLHTADKPLAERAGQLQNCSRCHDAEIASHRRFERQGIVFDQLNCYDCHDVHQLTGKSE